MKVSEALDNRISCRSFLSQKVNKKIIKNIIKKAGKSPSGGNLQPWQVFVLADKNLRNLIKEIKKDILEFPKGHPTEYEIYPKNLPKIYIERRFKCGEDLYSILKINREDKEKRREQFKKNFELFGAPIGIFVYIDRTMGYPQWSDVGMFVQSLLLLAKENNLDTCAQESWASFHNLVNKHTKAPKNLMLFCGIAMGYMNPASEINKLKTERASLNEVAKFIGF
ncbi:MAG: nitroreductase [Paracoccaceae bacterium]